MHNTGQDGWREMVSVKRNRAEGIVQKSGRGGGSKSVGLGRKSAVYMREVRVTTRMLTANARNRNKDYSHTDTCCCYCCCIK